MCKLAVTYSHLSQKGEEEEEEEEKEKWAAEKKNGMASVRNTLLCNLAISYYLLTYLLTKTKTIMERWALVGW